jgi:hypothetical protein
LAWARPTVHGLFDAEQDRPTRAALAGARVMLGDWSPDLEEALLHAEQASIYRAVRLGDELTVRPAKTPAGMQEYKGHALQDIVGLPVHSVLSAWIRLGRSADEDDRFFEAARCVEDLFHEAQDEVWDAA